MIDVCLAQNLTPTLICIILHSNMKDVVDPLKKLWQQFLQAKQQSDRAQTLTVVYKIFIVMRQCLK